MQQKSLVTEYKRFILSLNVCIDSDMRFFIASIIDVPNLYLSLTEFIHVPLNDSDA